MELNSSLVIVQNCGYSSAKAQHRFSFMKFVLSCICTCTRGIQKVCRLTQLTTRYAHHILSFFNIDTCNWNALGPAFLQSSDPVVEELLFLVFQPATRRADNVLVVRKFCVFSWILWVQEKTEVTWSQDNASDHRSAQALAAIQNSGFELLYRPPYLPFVFVLHGKWLAGRPGTTILLQRYQSNGQMLDQVHFSCRCLCWKVTKYDVCIS